MILDRFCTFSIFADLDETKRQQTWTEMNNSRSRRRRTKKMKWYKIELQFCNMFDAYLTIDWPSLDPNDIFSVMIFRLIILFHLNEMTILFLSLLCGSTFLFCRVCYHFLQQFIFHISYVCNYVIVLCQCMYMHGCLCFLSFFLILVFNQLRNGFCWLKT